MGATDATYTLGGWEEKQTMHKFGNTQIERKGLPAGSGHACSDTMQRAHHMHASAHKDLSLEALRWTWELNRVEFVLTYHDQHLVFNLHALLLTKQNVFAPLFGIAGTSHF